MRGQHDVVFVDRVTATQIRQRARYPPNPNQTPRTQQTQAQCPSERAVSARAEVARHIEINEL